MRALVLLKLLNELGKRYQMRGLPSILYLFRNEFNKLNNTRARMLDSFYLSRDIKKLKNCIFGVKTLSFFPYFTQHYMYNGRHYFFLKSVNH